MSLQTAHDVALLITSPDSSSERRITPSWTIAQLKTKLEPVTGIPPSAQKLILKGLGSVGDAALEAPDEEAVQLGQWQLVQGAEIIVQDLRPPAARINLTDPSSVEKYSMPSSQYETLPDSVLAWKKSHKLGRFDPNAPAVLSQKASMHATTASERGIRSGLRCRIGEDSTRRGTVLYLGDVPDIPGVGGVWVGVGLDEPVGKNDGSVAGKSYFHCPAKHGVFVRPERVEVGDWPVLSVGEEDEEI